MQPRLPFDEPALHCVRHPRARRYVIRVQDDGSVRVTIPRWGSKKEAVAFATREQPWIDEQRRQLAIASRLSALETASPDRGDAAALRDRAKRLLPARLADLAAQYGLTVTRVSIRDQKGRWGSCSPGGHICLNWRLVAMPDWIRDYVLIHELMHLKRMDHSPAFWRLVAAACPEFQAARAWLRARFRG